MSVLNTTAAIEMTQLQIYETGLTTVNVSFMIILEIYLSDITDTTLTSIQNEFENQSVIQIELIDVILVISDESDTVTTTTTTTDMPSNESDEDKSDSNLIIIIVVTSVSVLLICLCGGLIYCMSVKRRSASVTVEMVRYESNFKGNPPPPFKVNWNSFIYTCRQKSEKREFTVKNVSLYMGAFT